MILISTVDTHDHEACGARRRQGSLECVRVALLLIAAVAGSVAATVRALVPVYRDRLRWSFYRHVYDHGGRRDLKAAAGALEPGDDDDDEDD